MPNRAPVPPRRSHEAKLSPQGEMARRAILDDLDDTPGLKRSDFLKHLLRFLRAKRAITASHDGEITDTLLVDDHAVQLAAWKEGMVLRQEYPSKQVAVDATFHVEQLDERVIEIARLEAEGLLGRGDIMDLAGLREGDTVRQPKPPPDDA